MKPITVKYQGECRKCGATLSVGDKAIYERHIGIFCPECEPTDPEEIRQYRQEARDRKAERYEDWAAKRKEKAEAQLNSHPEIRHDIAFITQPGRIPFRDRMNRADERAFESLKVVQQFEEKADRLRSKPQVKGDAEKRWQALRDLNMTRFKVGDMVDCGAYAPGRILKIKKKTAKIEGRFGNYNVDLALLSPVTSS